MFAQCPHCQTVFAVSPDHLDVAGGRVRCGHCLKPFDASMHWVDALPDSEASTAHETEAPALSDTLRQVAVLPDAGTAVPAESTRPAPPVVQASAGAKPAELPQAKPETLPEALAPDIDTPRAPVSWGARIAGFLLALLLLVAAAAQYAWFMPEDLLRPFPRLRPWLAQAFQLTGRELPVPRYLSRLQLISRDVRAHPRYANVLRVHAKLVNRAGEVQPYPRLRLTLFDVTGAVVAARTFDPGEYLHESLSLRQGMRADVPVQVRLDILAPETGAVSYEFQFL